VPIVLSLLNLNNTGTGPDTNPEAGGGAGFVGGANHAWKLLGTVHLTAGSTYTVTQTSNADSFVSQRAHGVMWELTPEPSLGIYTWEYIDPNDPSLGKRQSTTLCSDGAGVNAVPFANLSGRNLTMAYLDLADLHGANLRRANFSQANLTFGNLSGADLTGANLSDATLTDAVVKNAKLSSTHITLDQLYSTASYVNHDLTGVHFVGNDLSGANLAGQQLASASFYAAKLTGANFANADLNNAELVNADLSHSNLTGANLTNSALALANLNQANLTNANLSGANFIGANLAGAKIRGANLSKVQVQSPSPVSPETCGRKHNGGLCWDPTITVSAGTGISLAQLVSTASFSAGDLSGVSLENSNFNGGNFASFNLTNASLHNTWLIGADFSFADARGSIGLESVTAANFIRPDGHVDGVNLGTGQILAIRDYDGNSRVGTGPIPINVDQHFNVGTDGTLRMLFETDAWSSTVSFAPGIPVSLGGTLELAFADGVDSAHQRGRTFRVFDWTGIAPTGEFHVTNSGFWDLTKLYSTGEVTVVGGTPSLAEVFGGLEFPQGVASFADMIIGNEPLFDGGPAPTHESFIDPVSALGSPNYSGGSTGTGSISLGRGGRITLKFTDNLLTGSGDDAPDLHIFEVGPSVEDTFVEISKNGTIWFDVGKIFGGTSSIDIDAFGFGRNDEFAFVRLRDDPNKDGLAGATVGADIDAVGAISTRVVPEPSAVFLLMVGLIATSTSRRTRTKCKLATPLTLVSRVLIPIVLLSASLVQARANPPEIQLSQVGAPIWKPIDFQLFSAPATPFNQEFGKVYSTLLPYDNPLVATYVPHAPPYDTELSAGSLAGGYVSQAVFTPDQIMLNPNGVYFAFMFVPDPGITGSSRDFDSGPVILNSVFPLAINVDVWLDGVLVDRLPGVDDVIHVQPKDVAFQGTSHLESIQAIWHPWDDDLTVGPLGNYDLRASIRDVGGSGWDVLTQFRVAVPGDYDYSGTVGPEDYGVWKANFGSTTNLDADGNDDHVVNAPDYTVWRDNLGGMLGFGSGSTLPSAAPLSATVPEPASILVAAVGILGLAARAGRQLVFRRGESTTQEC
jgi:uncharacterized protein YjbI with pentapeptide repeats